jgi:hypothetical protein
VHSPGSRAVNTDVESSPPFPPVARVATAPLGEAWHLAVRVAFVTSLVAAATGVVLIRLVGLSPLVIVPVLAFAGWMVGCHLPPACPEGLEPQPFDEWEDELAA